MNQIKPVVLCILDGWGLRPETKGNAVALAKTPNFDRVMKECPSSTLITYGPDVGLPEGQMGNSEVGHMNIGAGRVVNMDLRKIDAAIEDGGLAQRPAIQDFIKALTKSGGAAHLCGVLSDGGVHSHIDHLMEAARIVAAAGIRVNLHLFADGRDVAPQSALEYLSRLEPIVHGNISIASLSGRYYALDRDNRWARVEAAYSAIVQGVPCNFKTAKEAVNAAYGEDVTDEFIQPTAIDNFVGIRDGDALMFLNFRADRAREILSAIGDPEFDAFDTGSRPKLVKMTGFAEYSDRHNSFMDAVFPNEDIVNTLGHWLAQKGRKQFRIAETEKYPHVTFFLNGGVEVPEDGETRYLAPSPKVATYDLQPEMSSAEVTENLVDAINSETYDLIVVNYANPDMVGHTGDLAAAMAACEAVDQGLGCVLAALEKAQGAMVLCADHGNCETMIDPDTGEPHTAHTTNPVPVAVIGATRAKNLRSGGRLADLAPTLLDLMGIDVPLEMTGKTLIKEGA